MNDPKAFAPVVAIEGVRILRGVHKVCRCVGVGWLVDEAVHKVFCRRCGAEIDPFRALLAVARRSDDLEQRYQAAYAEWDALQKEVAKLKRQVQTLRRDGWQAIRQGGGSL